MGAGTWWTPRRAIAALVLVSALLMIPALLTTPMVHDSWWIDIVWADQFTNALRHGQLYPRWLPESFEGLGAPVFYFYPPGAFYLVSLFGLAGLSAYPALLAAFFTVSTGGAIATWQWLRGWTRRPLAGAMVALLAPYHLCDFYRRGAIAEATAAALLPLLAMALRRAGAGRGWGAAALAYAAIVMTHLPLALIASLFLIAPWGGWMIWRNRAAALPLAAGIGVGLALSAFYLIPALGLQPAISAGQLWGLPGLTADNWSIWRYGHWPDVGIMLVMLLLTGSMIAAALICDGGRRERWTLWTIACSLLAIGAVPGLWRLPPLDHVQFAWRTMALAEFGLAIAIARSRASPALVAAPLIPLAFISMLFLQPIHSDSGETPASLVARHPDVTEYLPAGLFEGLTRDWERVTATARAAPAVHYEEGETTVRRFHFPAWEAWCPSGRTETYPAPDTRLLRYRGRDCRVRLGMTGYEKIGGTLSLAALFLLCGLAVRRRRR